jgi:hypothetical protein
MTARSHRKAVVWIAIACAAVVSVALGYPRPVSHPILGDGWQCSRMAFLTSCTRSDHRASRVDGLPTAPVAFRRV